MSFSTLSPPFSRSIALIGAGYWGKNLARNLDALGVLHTLCDTNPALLSHYQTMYPTLRCTSDYTSLLEDHAISAVFIAAPALQHAELVRSALQAKKHVFVEKPLCFSVEEALDLIACAKHVKRTLMVGHLLHYHPCVQMMRELISNGSIGTLQYIIAHRMNLGALRTEENALWNFAPHDVSLILLLTQGVMPTSVTCVGGAYVTPGVADLALTTLHFDGPLKAHIYVSWLHPFKEQKTVVVGSQGFLIFDDTKPWAEKLLLHRGAVCRNQAGVPMIDATTAAVAVHVPQAEPLREECLHFLLCCQTGATPRTDGEEALRVTQVLAAADASLHQNGTHVSCASMCLASSSR